jgi:hypothetical protein
MELDLLLQGCTAPEAQHTGTLIDSVADFEREHYENSLWFKTSTWLTVSITLGSTVMVLAFVAKHADALEVVRFTLFPVLFTLCFVLFSFGIFTMIAKDL